MPDQTPVTDDDRRKARLWAEKVDPAEVNPGYVGTPRDIYSAARVILATVPAPPATLADELRYRATLLYNGDPDGDSAAVISALADRVESVEEACAKAQQDAVDAWEHAAQADKDHVRSMEWWGQAYDRVSNKLADATCELGEARAEVEQLTVSLNRQCTTVTPSVHNTDVLTASNDTPPDPAEVGSLTSGRTVRESRTVALPDPADVPKGEPWLVTVSGAQGIGFRHGDTMYAWGVAYEDGIDGEDDSSITLVSRLVPDVRRVIDRPEDLDKLPVGSIVIDEDGDPGKKIGEEHWGRRGAALRSEVLLRGGAEVTLIHEPEVTA